MTNAKGNDDNILKAASFLEVGLKGMESTDVSGSSICGARDRYLQVGTGGEV